MTGLHSFTYGVLKIPSLVYDCACVFLYDTIGGCGKITLSSCWFWIKYQFFNSISLTYGAPALYLVTNGKIFLRVLGFCCKAALLLSKLTSVFSQGIVNLSFLTSLWFGGVFQNLQFVPQNLFLRKLFLIVLMLRFDKTSFNSWRVT